MNVPWRRILLATGVVVGIGLWLGVRSESPEQRTTDETRRKLKEIGFKTDLNQFDFSTAPETRARVAALTNNVVAPAPGKTAATARNTQFQHIQPERLFVISSNSAVVVWKQQKWPAERSVEPFFTAAGLPTDDIWPAVRQYLQDLQEQLDTAAQAAIGGPIRFHLRASDG